VFIQGRNEQFYSGENEYCLFRKAMNSVYSGKKRIMSMQGRNE
jgi:hypothetical protein